MNWQADSHHISNRGVERNIKAVCLDNQRDDFLKFSTFDNYVSIGGVPHTMLRQGAEEEYDEFLLTFFIAVLWCWGNLVNHRPVLYHVWRAQQWSHYAQNCR